MDGMHKNIRGRVYENPRLDGGSVIFRRYPLKMPGWNTLPMRVRIAWRLRWWADKLDRDRSYTISGMWPAGMTDQDLFEAMGYAAVAMQEYMTDLQAERRIK